jgi:L-fuculose-phosphate aldolase
VAVEQAVVFPALAEAASQGASIGTSFDISFSRDTTVARSGRIDGSGGAVPVGPESLYVMRVPSAKCLGLRHGSRQRTSARDRPRFEQLAPAEDPVVHSAGEVTIRPVTLDAVREQVAAAGRRLAAEGLVLGTAGNISARRGDEVAITPTGAVLAELEPEQVSVVDLGGRQVHGDLAPTSELDLHLGVYRRYDAGAVVHTHAPMATALSCVLDELPCVHYQMLLLGGPVPVAPYATFGTPELARSVLDALEGRRAALMANHGAIAHGEDLDAALELSLLLEWACTVYWRAAAIGEPRVLGAEQREAVVAAALARDYGTTHRVEEGG